MSPAPSVVVVGGGIVGLAVAHHLLQTVPGIRVRVLEKEAEIALHQTGRNSGVVHSGIYYKPGSLKAVTCSRGRVLLEQFCQAESVPFERCGKVIVAVDDAEVVRLRTLHELGQANGLACELIDRARLRQLEPHAEAVAALHVPETGIVDFVACCHALGKRIITAGGEVVRNACVVNIHEGQDGVTAESTAGVFSADFMVNCGGLFSDRLARLSGGNSEIRIVPFRGEYFLLRPAAQGYCRNLIYPVPDPDLPFLGVHFTRRIGGGVECGPNAVLAFAREGYAKTDLNIRDMAELLTFPGFYRMAWKQWRSGVMEMERSLRKPVFVKALQRLVPEVTADDLVPGGAGVRAQAVSADGRLVDDFVFHESRRILHVVNAPSPAATASLAIAEILAGRLAARF